MIIGKYFDGDTDEDLKMYQHGCYYDMLCHWINLAGVRRLQYRDVPEWWEVIRQWEEFRQEGVFDHRCIQPHHDLIAANYRMAQDAPMRIRGKGGWSIFFDQEATKLMNDPELLRLFMTALAFANTPVGYDAEDLLLHTMKRVYGMETYLTREQSLNTGGQNEA